MDIDWVSFFSSKRSNMLNVIIGIWFSFIFGLTSILSSEATSSILALVAFLILAGIITIYYYPKYHYFRAWEKYSIKNGNKIEPSIIENFENSNYPSPDYNNINQFIKQIKPKNSLELFVHCVLWGGFIVFLLLWDNNTVQEILYIIVQVTEIKASYEIPSAQYIEFGLRHFTFILYLFSSIYIFLVRSVYEKAGKKKKITVPCMIFIFIIFGIVYRIIVWYVKHNFL